MFTDMVGYTTLSQRNESLALDLLEEQKRMVRALLSRYGGREIKTIGDSFMVEFASALEAVRCATRIQEVFFERNTKSPQEKKIQLRIGIHIGDVEHKHGDVYGDAVNIASRMEPLSGPGGICISEQVYYQIQNKAEFPIIRLGKQALKNIQLPMDVYRIVLPWEKETHAEDESLEKRRIAVLPLVNMTADPNDEYFADGMTEELISTISGISGLTVLSRTSIMQYKGARKNIVDIGKELNAGTILEGSVRKAGNRVRITVQLVDSPEDRHLWAQSYDREL